MEGTNIKLEGLDAIKEKFDELLGNIDERENKSLKVITDEIVLNWNKLSQDEKQLITLKLAGQKDNQKLSLLLNKLNN